MSNTPGYRMECPVWYRHTFTIVPGGIEVKCKSCRGGAAHFYSREELEQKWEALEKQRQETPTKVS